jgi:uridylate kinase
MDQTAITLAQENNMPILVFSLMKEGNLEKVLSGDGFCSIIS